MIENNTCICFAAMIHSKSQKTVTQNSQALDVPDTPKLQ